MEHEGTREFGTGLRDYLERHGVRMDARARPASNTDLLTLSVQAEQSPEPVRSTHRLLPLAA